MEYGDIRDRYRSDKIEEINQHLLDGCDIDWLRHKALSRYGLVNDDVRKRVWPMIVGVDVPSPKKSFNSEVLENHPQARQIELDVRRMLSLIPTDCSPEEIERLISETKHLALSILHEHPELHYYQGFHDICFVFNHVLGPDVAFACLDKIVLHRFSLFMQKTMDSTSEMLQLVFDLLEFSSPEIWSRLQSLKLEPFFALSWLITWFTHILSDQGDIHRLYDVFLASDPLMLIYLSVAVIVCSTVELKSTSDDFGELHHALTVLPMKHDVEKLIACAFLLFQMFSPVKLLQRADMRRIPRTGQILPRSTMSQLNNVFVAVRHRIPNSKIFLLSFVVLCAGVFARRFF